MWLLCWMVWVTFLPPCVRVVWLEACPWWWGAGFQELLLRCQFVK